jgi:hypothetical protein
MGYEPTTYCKRCNEPFDVYRAPEERICDDCIEEGEIETLINDVDRARARQE